MESGRLLQDEIQTYDVKRLCRWFASRVNARQEATLVGEEIWRERMDREQLTKQFERNVADLPLRETLAQVAEQWQSPTEPEAVATPDEKPDTVGKEVRRLLGYYRRARVRLDALGMEKAKYTGLDDYMVERLSQIFADSLDK